MTISNLHSPYPQSAVITAVDWEPEVVRDAQGKTMPSGKKDGSDNWPLTWSDDGHLYTAYGDGYGFDPLVPSKLGLGFARVIGDAGGFRGENIRSNAENSGYGRKGKKASGILMVDGVLYLLVRNANDNGATSQLAWSHDKAKTWTWCDWVFEELGYPTFINFGQNDSDARDGYVYIVSHDNPDAYVPADRFVLARAPKEGLRDRDAYTFFKGRDRDGNPAWSPDIADRDAIFTFPGQCMRSGISYNAPLKRYLWWQVLGGQKAQGDSRFEGGFGVYDAPEPWGPWTTVYFTEKWDVGPGESGNFPTKWMSGDGRTVFLVFSGDDNFAVRKATLSVADTQGR